VKFCYYINILALLGSVSLAPCVAHSDPRNQFFDSHVVDDFSVPVTEQGGSGFDYFIDTKAKKEQALEPRVEQPQTAPPLAVASAAPQEFTSGEDVLKAYGDPTKDAPVLAQDNAPKPFKAMMAAFETGDDQLAYQYARQWVRYMGNIQKRTQRVVEAAKAAQQGEAILSDTAAESNHLRQMIVNDNANLAANLDPRAQAILKQAEADESVAPQNSQNPLEQQELKAREEVRRQIAGKIPVDTQGRADVYVFLGVNDKDSEKFALLANQIYERASMIKNVNFAAFSTARLNKDAMVRISQRLGLKFDLLVGDSFSKELQLRETPAVVIVSPTSGKVIKETGDKPFFYYDELIAAVQGR